MDPVTHTLIGVGIANAFFRRRVGPAAVPVLILASNLPDVDALVHVTGSPAAVLLRRTFGHSLFTIPAWCALLAILLERRYAHVGRRPLFGMCLLGAGVHVFFDLVNSFGVVLLWPFSGWRPELAILFIIDLVLAGLLLLPLVACLPRRMRGRLEPVSRIGVACAAAYVVLCGAARGRAGAVLEGEAGAREAPAFTYVFPEPFGPQRWRGVAREDGLYRVYLVRPLAGTAELRSVVGTQPQEPDVRRVRASPLGSRLEWFFKAPVWKSDGSGNVRVYDLRFAPLVVERRPVFEYAFRVHPEGRVEPLGWAPAEVRPETYRGGPARPGGGQSAVPPPSTASTAPVMNEESSVARNSAARAISSGVPMRPSGRLAASAR